VNRDDAIALLKGGPDGVLDWNTRRANGEQIPSLENADLFRADLTGANLSRADLRGANLYGANLDSANLSEADLYTADLAKADLSGANLSAANLCGARLSRGILLEADFRPADLSGADLRGADLLRTDLEGADLRRAVLSGARLGGAYLGLADIREADLSRAHLYSADLREADLREADLHEANLSYADLSMAKLTGANLSRCRCRGTLFCDLDLSEVKGLESIQHDGPSFVGVETLFKSKGKILEAFLRGCGVPDALIATLPALLGSMKPVQFYSCFLSHSSADKDFARRLHSRMRDEGLRVWFDEVQMQGGKKLHEQIDEAIRTYDKLLIVLSPHSMNSDWVKTELRKAFQQERREGQRKLFPIGLVPYSEVRDWECFDADHGKDLAVEVREYLIPDFSNWKDNDAFEAAFGRLLRDLKADVPPAGAAATT
jgi:uncharacterized protein YjbI with pentapeptide repeats